MNNKEEKEFYIGNIEIENWNKISILKRGNIFIVWIKKPF